MRLDGSVVTTADGEDRFTLRVETADPPTAEAVGAVVDVYVPASAPIYWSGDARIVTGTYVRATVGARRDGAYTAHELDVSNVRWEPFFD